MAARDGQLKLSTELLPPFFLNLISTVDDDGKENSSMKNSSI